MLTIYNRLIGKNFGASFLRIVQSVESYEKIMANYVVSFVVFEARSYKRELYI